MTTKQFGVLKGMIGGLVTAFVILAAAAWQDPLALGNSADLAGRIAIAILASLAPAVMLAFAVGRLARHRFFTPQDIDGGGISTDSETALVLQTLLQNTLEQCCIAVLAYLAWAVVMPAAWLSALPAAAICFTLGRVLFFAGYRHGAAARSLGFALTFYPSVLMLAAILARLAWVSIG